MVGGNGLEPLILSVQTTAFAIYYNKPPVKMGSYLAEPYGNLLGE